MVKQGILFVSSYTRHRPLANAACLVAGAIVTSLAFHPTESAGTPIAGEFPSVQLTRSIWVETARARLVNDRR
jgi:hypothetical protein